MESEEAGVFPGEVLNRHRRGSPPTRPSGASHCFSLLLAFLACAALDSYTYLPFRICRSHDPVFSEERETLRFRACFYLGLGSGSVAGGGIAYWYNNRTMGGGVPSIEVKTNCVCFCVRLGPQTFLKLN